MSASRAEQRRVITAGKAQKIGCDNSIQTARYTIYSFIPVTLIEQFRRLGNMFFLVLGALLCLSHYYDLFEAPITPFTTVLPLAMFVSFSLLQEGYADLARHKSDTRVNVHKCVVLDSIWSGRKKALKVNDGNDITTHVTNASNHGDEESNVKILKTVSFQEIKRADIFPGSLVLIKNREMVPADVVILASSGDMGGSYIETSSIDGETNLKTRSSPNFELAGEAYKPPDKQSLEDATKRIVKLTCLGYPNGIPADCNPLNNPANGDNLISPPESPRKNINGPNESSKNFFSLLISELPNASVNTYSGQLIIPPLQNGTPSPTIPLGAENLLLRGAVLRNTAWVIGVAVFTGRDTKLVKNSFKTPSKLSKLDELINRTIILILVAMLFIALILALLANYTLAANIDNLWYAGYNRDVNEPWPYLRELGSPKWILEPPALWQHFLTFFLFDQ